MDSACEMSSSGNSSDSDVETAMYYYFIRRRRRLRRFWVHPYIERNFQNRLFVAAKQLELSDSKFLAFFRMTKESYLELLNLVSPVIQKQNTNMRESVGTEERLLITLRYLGTGGTFTSIAVYFARGESTVGCIVAETTKLIWNALHQTYMAVPTMDEWIQIAERFYSLWNLENCIGAIDGKHVRIEKFPNTGSANYNYKSFHSVVLMACCDADGNFTMIETGYAGRNSDGGIFRASAIKHWILNDGLGIPPPSPLKYDASGSPFPYYFVGDEAFPLSRYLMRPYPSRSLDNVKRVFNYRLSRGRKTIECAFGMACEKFAVLNGPIRIRDPENVKSVIKAACVLHNFVRKREGLPYTSSDTSGNGDADGVVMLPVHRHLTIHNNSRVADLRDYLANYFLTPQASLPWQWKYMT